MGTFTPLGQDVGGPVREGNPVVFGIRLCANPSCRAVVFFSRQTVAGPGTGGAAAVRTRLLPPETIDFDTTGLPLPVLVSLEEAIVCHANGCYVASAIMVRKCLEELCEDRQATGKRLVDRIKELGKRIVVPQELIDGADTLRLLGNDAAHVELSTFTQVGREEVEVAIEFTKELLKATYQYASLLSRMNALKKP